ncbi:hypothetical protein [Corynebacterium sp. p3-SID1194]|uniref:hypothetical protein n=1 Tax=Corynebacterium sp. p3-SID1194 TaxID=2916105 RepID=UPI0021A2C0B5|nr:hypothetical protein [Corynebacterium sp. p3-SID1194]MCT1450653.1 hypothetical protein [Corynebacterium sp. p3-SID1194]
MVRVSGEIKDVLGSAVDVSRVLLRAPRPRPAGFGLVTDHPDEVEVTGGHLEFECLPGPAVIGVAAVGHPDVSVRLLVPDVESATLEECIRLAVARGEAHAGELDAMLAKLGADLQIARKAINHANAAAESAGAAEGFAQDAEGSKNAAAESAEAAEGFAQDAEGSKNAAAESAEAASNDAKRVATIAGSTRWIGTQLEVNGVRSPNLKGDKGEKGDTGPQGASGMGVIASESDPGRNDVLWINTGANPAGVTEPIGLVASGTGWQYATRPGSTDRYVVDYRGWAVLTVAATGCDEVRIYDFSQASNPFSVGSPPPGNIKGSILTTQLIVDCVDRGPAVRVLNPTEEARITLSVSPLRKDGRVMYVPDGSGGRVPFTAIAGPDGKQGPAGTTTWDGISGKPDTFPPATHTHTVSDLSDISVGVRNTLKSGNTSTTASSTGAVAWGRGAKATNTDAVALGYTTQASGTDSAALGSYSKVKQNQHVVVGVDATDEGVAQQRGTVIIGKTGAPVIISGRNVVSELDSLGEQVATRATKNEVTRRPALFSGPGPCPPDIADRGAVVGDHWLNTDTMELERITGV